MMKCFLSFSLNEILNTVPIQSKGETNGCITDHKNYGIVEAEHRGESYFFTQKGIWHDTTTLLSKDSNASLATIESKFWRAGATILIDKDMKIYRPFAVFNPKLKITNQARKTVLEQANSENSNSETDIENKIQFLCTLGISSKVY